MSARTPLVATALVLALLVVTAIFDGRRLPEPDPTELGPFPLSWYDATSEGEALPAIADEGMDLVVPYHSDNHDLMTYLDAAWDAGVQVLVHVDQDVLAPLDIVRLTLFVNRYKHHPAVHGWYLADEPSINEALGPMTAQVARRAYQTIKRLDPDHPVAIAFGVDEEPARYATAMDVMMFDDYPAIAGRTEFEGFDRWWDRLRDRAATGAREDGFVPIIQAFGEDDDGQPQHERRLPTRREQRYMVYAAVQAGATGLSFWVRYRADPAWVEDVLVPLTDEVEPLRGAFARGPTSERRQGPVLVTSYADPASAREVVLAVNHSGDEHPFALENGAGGVLPPYGAEITAGTGR